MKYPNFPYQQTFFLVIVPPVPDQGTMQWKGKAKGGRSLGPTQVLCVRRKHFNLHMICHLYC
jgi:hypothetical protein